MGCSISSSVLGLWSYLEDPLEKGMVTQSSILAWRIPWTEEPGGLQSMGSHRVDMTEHTHTHTHTHTHCCFCHSGAESCPTLRGPTDCSKPGFSVPHHLPELLKHMVWAHMVFSNESALHIRWPKDWSFRFSISLSNEYSALISFRIDIPTNYPKRLPDSLELTP